MRALSAQNEKPEEASRPFDKNRDGFVIGEGAGILILEEMEMAKKRGTTIFAEIVGYGMSGDAFHITQPSEDGEGACQVMTNALKDANIQAEQVDYINAHGTSTPFNDRNETKAIKRTFGKHAYHLLVSSTKSMTGHLLGAAGGLEGGNNSKRVTDGMRTRRTSSTSSCIRPLSTKTNRNLSSCQIYN